MPVKSEGGDSASYGVTSMPTADGMPNGQDNTMWRNGGAFNGVNGDSHFTNGPSMAGGPNQHKATGVLTGTF